MNSTTAGFICVLIGDFCVIGIENNIPNRSTNSIFDATQRMCIAVTGRLMPGLGICGFVLGGLNTTRRCWLLQQGTRLVFVLLIAGAHTVPLLLFFSMPA